MISLTIAAPPAFGFTVTGSGFAPNSWIWITVEDLSDNTKPVDGPDAFHPNSDGTFNRVNTTTPLACGHWMQANAFVSDTVVAQSSVVAAPKCPPVPKATAPVDPNSTAAVKTAFTNLVQKNHRLVIGQALRAWDSGLNKIEPAKALTDKGLPAPKFLEVELTEMGPLPAPGVTDVLYDYLDAHVAKGGLIGFSFHVGNPFHVDPKTGKHLVGDRTDVDLPKLADPNNPMGGGPVWWRDQLDYIADILAHFDSGVVLFRPFHESNGDWFWWGQPDPAEFRTAWNGMFQYLTVTKGRHNLLWVYAAARDDADGGSLKVPTRYFPGADLVDLVGLDIYNDDLSDAAPNRLGYEALANMGKPFAVTEYAAQNWPTIHDGATTLQNDKVRDKFRDAYPDTVLASCWYSSNNNNWQISDKPNPAALLNDPIAIIL
jgi:hypothetical protein